MHFGIPRSIISDRDTIFISALWTTLWDKMDTNLKRYTVFHPQTDGMAKKSSQQDFGVASKGIQPKSSEDLG